MARIRAGIDLGFVIGVFLLCSALEPTLDPLLRRGQGASGILALAAYQFACEGCALLVVLTWRKETLSAYGFTRPRMVRSITLAVAFAAINDLGISLIAREPRWLPFGRHTAARMAMDSGVPTAVAGIGLAVVVWGFVEAVFGVFFAQKINTILGHDGRGWWSPGALGFATFNGLIHFSIGQGAVGFATSFASGYAIGVLPAVTGNAWGSAVFQTLTNAVGHP